MHVLQIEDDSATAQAVAQALRSHGFTCDTAGLGEDAIELALRNRYDLILLDVMLPDIDGYEVLRRLRAEEIHTPVVIQTALIGRDDVDKCASFGIRDYLIKPFNGRELKDCVAAILERASVADEPEHVNGQGESDRRKTSREEKSRRRRQHRTKTLKSGQIIYKNSNCVVNCLVINISDGGAALQVLDMVDIPETFLLKLQNGPTYRCHLCWRHANKIGAMFLHSSG